MTVNPSYELWGELLKSLEGLRLTAYADKGGVITIGYGTTYRYDLKRKVLPGDSITHDKALEYMMHDRAEVVRQANFYIKQWLNVNRSTAICDYIYNRGIKNFLKTQLDELINANPLDSRIPQVIKGTGWRDRLGVLWPGLVRRRKMEAELWVEAVKVF